MAQHQVLVTIHLEFVIEAEDILEEEPYVVLEYPNGHVSRVLLVTEVPFNLKPVLKLKPLEEIIKREKIVNVIYQNL